jgi:hypothetical protein
MRIVMVTTSLTVGQRCSRCWTRNWVSVPVTAVVGSVVSWDLSVACCGCGDEVRMCGSAVMPNVDEINGS